MKRTIMLIASIFAISVACHCQNTVKSTAIQNLGVVEYRPAIPTAEKDTLFIENSSTGRAIRSLWDYPAYLKDKDNWPHFVTVTDIRAVIARIKGLEAQRMRVTEQTTN